MRIGAGSGRGPCVFALAAGLYPFGVTGRWSATFGAKNLRREAGGSGIPEIEGARWRSYVPVRCGACLASEIYRWDGER